MQQALQFIAEHKQLIDGVLDTEFNNRLAEVRAISPHLVPLLESMQELSVGGKRLRATLVFLGYQLAGGKDVTSVIRAAMAMELFHLGLLIQDDVMDGDSLRRGIKTIHARYDNLHLGESMAVNAGDICYGWVVEILSGLDLPVERVNQALSVWGKYFVRVGYGQVLDVLDIADEATILQILSIKSGEYSCVLPLLLGATLGGGSPELLTRLEQYGMALGQVFQLRDDWLGMYGESAKTGKPAGEQADKGKKTFATMYGQTKTEAAIAHHLAEGLKLAQGDPVMEGLMQWVATRES